MRRRPALLGPGFLPFGARERRAEHVLVDLTPALVTDLAELTAALDQPEIDLVDALRRLISDAKLAVRSFVGLTVTADRHDSRVSFTVVGEPADRADVLASLLVPLSPAGADPAVAPIAVVLYAARAGAFVDLAADLAWLTGRRPNEFVLDEHLAVPSPGSKRGGLHDPVVNQAIGVLLGLGYTPDQAVAELAARGADRNQDAHDVADGILGALRRSAPDTTPDG